MYLNTTEFEQFQAAYNSTGTQTSAPTQADRIDFHCEQLLQQTGRTCIRPSDSIHCDPSCDLADPDSLGNCAFAPTFVTYAVGDAKVPAAVADYYKMMAGISGSATILSNDYFSTVSNAFLTITQMFLGDSAISAVVRDMLSQQDKYTQKWWLAYCVPIAFLLFSIIVVGNLFTGLVVDAVMEQVRIMDEEQAHKKKDAPPSRWQATVDRVFLGAALAEATGTDTVAVGEGEVVQEIAVMRQDIASIKADIALLLKYLGERTGDGSGVLAV